MSFDLNTALMNVLLLWIITAPHEFAHAWVATKLGDETPRREGRVTLYPLAHVDWIGTALLPFVTSLFGGGFIGWGKPVRTEVASLRGGLNGLALVALAGPFANIVLAVLMGVVAVATRSALPAVSLFAQHGIALSIYLAIFNMLPVPPLDGSKLLLAARVPMVVYYELARFGFMLLVLVVSFTNIGLWMSQWSYIGARAIITALR
jgi:Zn-dependent protease